MRLSARHSLVAICLLGLGFGCGQVYDSIADDNLATKDVLLKVPKIIHQVWHPFDAKKPNPPANLRALSDEFRLNHPDWIYICWNKAKSEEFIKAYYPNFYPTYKAYSQEIQRVDAVRYFALDHFGGVYADFDSQSLRNLEPALRGFDAVFGEQPTFHHAINNGLMASVPKHPLWKFVFRELESSKDESTVLYSTGPEMLTRAVHKYLGSRNATVPVKVFSHKYFFPLAPEDVSTKGKACRKSSEACRKIFPDAFNVEHWTHSW